MFFSVTTTIKKTRKKGVTEIYKNYNKFTSQTGIQINNRIFLKTKVTGRRMRGGGGGGEKNPNNYVTNKQTRTLNIGTQTNSI